MPVENYKPLNCGGLHLPPLLTKTVKNRSGKAGAKCEHEKPFFANGKQRNFCYSCVPKPAKKARKVYEYKGKCPAFCLNCGLSFQKTQRHSKYCSDICRNKSNNVTSQMRRTDRSERPCRNCGSIFEPVYGVLNKLQCSDDCLKQFKAKQANQRMAGRMKNDPVLKLVRNMRVFVNRSIGRGGYTKRSRTQQILGCGWSFFKSHIEKQFLKGMSWSNRTEWHLDHIRPLASAKTEEEVVSLNHFTNLRPIWALENLSKGAQETHLI